MNGSGIQNTHPSIPELAVLVESVERVRDIVIITDQEGKVQYVNAAFERISGVGRNILAGSMLQIRDRHPARFLSGSKPAIRKGRLMISPAGEERKEIDVTIIPFLANNGADGRRIIVGNLSNQSEDYVKSGITSTLMHRFSNLLSVVMGYAEMTLEETPRESLPNRNLHKIISACEKFQQLLEECNAANKSAQAPLGSDPMAIRNEMAVSKQT